MIQEPCKQFAAHELPQIFNSKSVDEVRASVLGLNAMAKKLRTNRFAQGALRLDQHKLKFVSLLPQHSER
jgi:hypothetical protein